VFGLGSTEIDKIERLFDIKIEDEDFTTMAGFVGVTAMDVTVAVVSVVEPEIPANDALMMLSPAAAPAVAIPPAPIVAICVFDELQTACPVRS